MPEISLLEPTVLMGVVEKMKTPENLILRNRLSTQPWPYPVAKWDVIKGSRAVARPNVPNSEAHIIPRLGRSQESASFVYLREKKVFEPTTIHWIREPGELAARNAEAAVLREINDLNIRFDNFMEFCAWQALQGQLVFDYDDVQASIDYKFSASHKPSVVKSWNQLDGTHASASEIIADVRAWKRLIQRDGQVPVREAFCTEKTMSFVFEAFAADGNAAGLLSDRMRDEYFSSGTLPGFMGLNWTSTESVYEDAAGNETMFLGDGKVILANLTDNRPMEYMLGPSADDEAPRGFTGRYAKTWKEKDPSSRQYLLEQHFLPVIYRPEQILVATVDI